MALEQDNTPPFLIFQGGPFYNLQLKANLVRGGDLNPLTRALIFVTVAWGVPLLLSLIAGTAFGILEARPYLLDPGAFARFFLAIGLLVFAESQIENQLRDGVHQFLTGQLLDANSLAPARAAVRKALKRRDSRLAELVCLALAVLASAFVISNMQDQTSSSWAVTIDAGGRSLSLAAWWSIVVSNTLFWFLLMRATWRHIVWALLLHDFSRLQTRLVATHPDGHAGLAFVGRYPNAYVLFTVAAGCVIAAAVTHQVLHGTVTVAALGAVMGLWLAVIFVYFGIPLIGFARVLSKLKRQTLLAAAARATEYQRQSERNTLGKNVIDDDEKVAKDTEIPDPGKLYEAAKKLSPMLVTRSTLVPVSAAALLPFVAIGLTQLPVKELVPVLKRLLLL
ncbi:hypothetical protein LJR231_004860 [Phyllobacterium sp. LjRoot231]|uniref:hypothetical protein n=1 Tax=Phyllobacterium sp. LjRoot231 TaxID=3342289 RepID=UPI003ECCDDD3